MSLFIVPPQDVQSGCSGCHDGKLALFVEISGSKKPGRLSWGGGSITELKSLNSPTKGLPQLIPDNEISSNEIEGFIAT
jgi:hypothetical protein